MPAQALVDTDILSSVMRGDPGVVERAMSYLAEHGRLTFSVITRYEILRGLAAKGAVRQATAFRLLCSRSTVLAITDEIVDVAAAIYGELHRQGTLIGDADILIAASARSHGLEIVSNNLQHFRRIPGLRVESWSR